MNDAAPSPLDDHFAALMLRLHGEPHALLEKIARTVSARRAEGHICIPVDAAEAAALRQTRVVGAPGEFKPLILDSGGRLYLQRYWQYESDLARQIRARLEGEAKHDEARLAEGLTRIFGTATKTPDWQRLAAESAVRRRFCVITGGPGTGKTWTVAAVLALLHAQFSGDGRSPRTALAAPTGKAAARMKESIQHTLSNDPKFAGVKLESDATTLHRLLGTIPGSPYFRHHRDHPLAVDAVIIDEASMVDLALMAKVFDATPLTARIVLLGDKDQLASVEAGNVLGDICATPMPGHIVELQQNRRFGVDSGIHRVSRAVNIGDADAAIAALEKGAADLTARPLPTTDALVDAIREPVLQGYRSALEAATPGDALKALGDFRILCAVRRGPFGVENLNRLAETVLTEAGLIDPDSACYRGRPVMITTNDYQLGLFNGDIGILLPDAESNGELRAWFLDSTGTLRCVLPARLPAHETVFAMTVHKSQGSEFDRVLLILPDRDTPIATRELIYTGLTRARKFVELWHTPTTLRPAITRRTERTSGLGEAIAGK